MKLSIPSIDSLLRNLRLKRGDNSAEKNKAIVAIEQEVKEKLVKNFENTFNQVVSNTNLMLDLYGTDDEKRKELMPILSHLRDPRIMGGFLLDIRNNPNFSDRLFVAFKSDVGLTNLEGEPSLVEKLKNYNFFEYPAGRHLLLEYLNSYIDVNKENVEGQEKTFTKPEVKKVRIVNELVDRVSKVILTRFDEFIKNPPASLKGLNDNLKNALRFELEALIKKDVHDPYLSVIRSKLEEFSQTASGGNVEEIKNFIEQAATKLFDEEYKPQIIERALKMINITADPTRIENILKGEEIIKIQDEFSNLAKQDIDPNTDYFFGVSGDIYFTQLGRDAFLKFWNQNFKADPGSVANLFIAKVLEAGSFKHKEFSSSTNFKNNMDALIEDMQKLISVSNTHKAYFGTQSLPLIEFLIRRNLGEFGNVNKFDIEAPGLAGRDTTILRALGRMSKRNLFFPMAPDLKSEKWTLTINPSIDATKLLKNSYSSSLATGLKDLLMVFSYMGAEDPDSKFHDLWVAIKNVFLLFDKYCFTHLEEKNLEDLTKTGEQVTQTVADALERNDPARYLGFDNIKEQVEVPKETELPKESKTSMHSIHSSYSFRKYADENEARSLITSLIDRFHGVPLSDTLTVEVTEYASDELPWKVFNLQINNLFLRRIHQVDLGKLHEIMQGKNLASCQTIGQNKYVVKASYHMIAGTPVYNIAIAVPNKKYTESLKDALVKRYPELEKIKATTPGNWLEQAADILGVKVKDLLKQIKLSDFVNAVLKGIDFSTVSDKQARSYARDIMSPDKIFSMDPKDLKIELNTAATSHFIQSQYEFDYQTGQKKTKGSRESKISKEIAKIMEAFRLKFGVDSDTDFPPDLIKNFLDTLYNLEGIVLNLPAPVGHDLYQYINNLYNLVDKVLSPEGTLGDVAELHDAFLGFQDLVDKIMGSGEKEKGQKTLVSQDVKNVIISLANQLANYFVKNPKLDALINFGRLENMLTDLELNPQKMKDYRAIEDQLESIKKKFGLRLTKIDNLPPPELLEEALQALEEQWKGVPIEDTFIEPDLSKAQVPDPKDLKNPDRFKSIRPILPIGKNYSKFKDLFKKMDEVVKLDVKEGDPIYSDFIDLLNKSEQYSVPVALEESEITQEIQHELQRELPNKLSPKIPKVEPSSEIVLSWIEKAIQIFGGNITIVKQLKELESDFKSNKISGNDVMNEIKSIVDQSGLGQKVLSYIFKSQKVEDISQIFSSNNILPKIEKIKSNLEKEFIRKEEDILTNPTLDEKERQEALEDLARWKAEFKIVLDTKVDQIQKQIEYSEDVLETSNTIQQALIELDKVEASLRKYLESI